MRACTSHAFSIGALLSTRLMHFLIAAKVASDKLRNFSSSSEGKPSTHIINIKCSGTLLLLESANRATVSARMHPTENRSTPSEYVSDKTTSGARYQSVTTFVVVSSRKACLEDV